MSSIGNPEPLSHPKSLELNLDDDILWNGVNLF
jgi:hypothetical protein